MGIYSHKNLSRWRKQEAELEQAVEQDGSGSGRLSSCPWRRRKKKKRRSLSELTSDAVVVTLFYIHHYSICHTVICSYSIYHTVIL